MEEALVLLFAEIFEREDIGPEDGFFELGGDSLFAEALMTGIERDLEVVLPISTLLTAPTPRALTASVMSVWAQIPDSRLVAIRERGSGPPIIFVHGIGVAFARILAIAMGSDRPLYALQAAGLADGERPKASFNAIVEDYLAKTTDLWEDGPCVLVGHCAGSLVAYEMARRLRNTGASVPGLIMIDPPKNRVLTPWLRCSGLRFWLRRTSSRCLAILHHARQYWHAPVDGTEKIKNVVRAARYAAGSHVPEPYLGETLLIHSREESELYFTERGWPRLAPRLETLELGPTHLSLFQENAREIAAAMNAFLNRVAAV